MTVFSEALQNNLAREMSDDKFDYYASDLKVLLDFIIRLPTC